MFLQKAASSWNLFQKNPVVFKVAVNDYRFYKQKFLIRHKKQVIEDGLAAQIYWEEIKRPYEGKIKYGFNVKKQENWYNISWNKNKNYGNS